jgi:hypothetical protein
MMIATLSGVGTPPLMLALAVAEIFTVLIPRILAKNVGTWAVWTTRMPFAPFVPAQLADAAAHDGV